MAGAAFTSQVGNLPADVTSFVDRRQELAEVKRLLSTSRLVTLTGVGGVGKTRLAIRAAADVSRAFGAVWLADLSDLQDPALVGQRVAAAVGLRDPSTRSPVGALGEFLSGRRVLLLLDNCEHLLDACAALVTALLEITSDLHLLATSRQPLGVIGESTLTVTPLPVPDEQPISLHGLGQCASVGLFTDRATAVVPGFSLDEHNQRAIADLCRRLEGIPLAIELAAVRLRALSVTDIVARLNDRHRLLSGGPRAAPSRQRSLRDLVDWSFQLLPPRERALWTGASVFSGHFDLAAFQAIGADEPLPADEAADLLNSLVDKSLLIREEHDGQVRYRMLETLRQFGREQLDEHRLRAVSARHRDWYRHLIDQAAREWFGPHQVEWFDRLRREQSNIRAALAFCVREPEEAEIGLEMATRLHRPHWLAGSFFSEGRHWLDQLLRATAGGTPNDDIPTGIQNNTVAAARGHYTRAWLALIQADDATALPGLALSQELAERTGDPESLAYAPHIAGLSAVFRGEMAKAATLLDRAHERHVAMGDLFGVVMSALPLALALYRQGHTDRSAALLEESLRLTADHGESWCRAWTLTVLAIQLWRRGDRRRATALARESLLLNRALDDRHNMTLDIEVLAWIAADAGEHERAARLLGAAESVARTVGIAVLHFAIHIKYHDAATDLLRRAMGEEAYARAFHLGRQLTLEQTVAEALGEQQGPKPGRAAPDATHSPLTRRETEIAELIRQGLSNREIAEMLVISQRTAEGHVEHILAKLSLSSRTQVATWVANREPAPDQDD